MRVLVTAACVVLLLNVGSLKGADGISGRLVFEDGNFTCEQPCLVTLLAVSGRPVQTVSADLAGNFTFQNVPRGSYAVRVEIDGFQPVTYPVDSGYTNQISITVPRRPAAATNRGTAVVDVSEFLDRYPKKAVSYFEKGSEAVRKRKNDEAVKDFRNAVELAPTFYEAHHQLALAYREAGRREDAEREFLLAHELNSTNVEPLLNLITLYLEEDDTARAVSTGEQAVKANSRSAPAFFGFGVALYKAAQLDRAEAALRRALDLAPKMANVHLMLANVYLNLRRFDKTLEQLNTYIAENPKGDQLKQALHMRDQLLQAGVTDRP